MRRQVLDEVWPCLSNRPAGHHQNPAVKIQRRDGLLPAAISRLEGRFKVNLRERQERLPRLYLIRRQVTALSEADRVSDGFCLVGGGQAVEEKNPSSSPSCLSLAKASSRFTNVQRRDDP